MVQFGDRKIGDGFPCFITFEIGPTHNGFDSAKRLIKYAAEAGADAVKFQIFDPDRLIADKKQLFTYKVLVDRKTGETETISEPLYDLFVRRALTQNQWRELKKYCDLLGMAFFATVGFDDEVDFLEELECHSIKIASADVNHFPLLRRAARTGMCIQLDTGMATIGEIEKAVDLIISEGNEKIIIHQCPSGYPARLESINLNIIKTLKKMFNFPVAFSDHVPGMEMDIAALAIGANLLEKTITEDRMTRSVEHIMSLEPAEMKDFVSTIHNIEIALGEHRRILKPEEKKNREAVRRSAFLKKGVHKGTSLNDAVIEFRRPGYGLSPDVYVEMLERNLSFVRGLDEGHMVKQDDLVDQSCVR